jgi:hypothetical protein
LIVAQTSGPGARLQPASDAKQAIIIRSVTHIVLRRVNESEVAPLLLFAAIWSLGWISPSAKALLVDRLNKREKRQAHEDAVEELLQQYYSEDTINLVVRDGRNGAAPFNVTSPMI